MLHKGTVLKTVDILVAAEEALREEDFDMFGEAARPLWSVFRVSPKSILRLLKYLNPEKKEQFMKFLWNRHHKG